MSRPVVAVPAYPIKAGRVKGWEYPAMGAPARYIEALHRAGARESVLLPVALDDGEADEILDRVDGLLLLGGGDVDPAIYGQDPAEEVYGVVAERDAFELALVRAAVARRLPTLAICRGHQVLNVAFGGTLHQHISADGPVAHGRPGHKDGAATHDVRVQDGSRLAGALGVTAAPVSSHHHQTVDRVGDGLVPTAWADDGVVEGLELDDPDTWVVSAQWHPEDTAARDATQQRLFDAFVGRCR